MTKLNFTDVAPSRSLLYISPAATVVIELVVVLGTPCANMAPSNGRRFDKRCWLKTPTVCGKQMFKRTRFVFSLALVHFWGAL